MLVNFMACCLAAQIKRSVHRSCNKGRRCEQGSNLRGETPLDFKSNALTTRPSQLHTSGKTCTTAHSFSWKRQRYKIWLHGLFQLPWPIPVVGLKWVAGEQLVKETLRAGFEPARGNPIGFRVQRLNLSAITAYFTNGVMNRKQRHANMLPEGWRSEGQA